MPKPDEVFSAYDAVLADRDLSSPWVRHARTQPARYLPDEGLLGELLAIPIRGRHAQASGRLAKAIDAWCAHELRRAGFHPDEVWPRAQRPRVLPLDVANLLDKLPPHLAATVRAHVLRLPSVGPTEAHILGRVFVKQADVLIAQWSRGAELLISTKSMLSSYRNNLRNRFEESYGDAKNLRGRFPLLSMGFLYLLRSNILDDPAAWELAIDMLRKLRGEADVYDATALVVADWTDADFNGVKFFTNRVPEDLRLGQFMETLVGLVLDRTPVEFHVHVRELREGRALDIEEGMQPGQDEDNDQP